MSVYCRINVEHFGAPYCSALMLLTALFQPAFPRLLYLPHCRSEAHAIPRFQLALCLTTTQRKTAVKAETLFYRQPLLWVCPWRSRDITLHKGEADTLIWMGVDARLFAWFVFLLVCVCVNLLWPQLPFFLHQAAPPSSRLMTTSSMTATATRVSQESLAPPTVTPTKTGSASSASPVRCLWEACPLT